MIKLLDTVALTRDLDDEGLRAGDLGVVVDVHTPEVFEVEFVAESGATRALLALGIEDIRLHQSHQSIESCSPASSQPADQDATCASARSTPSRSGAT